MKISEFFKNEYVDYSSYDNLRKIASLVDGQKNSSRKILFTVLEKGIKKKVKVSQLSSKIEEFAEYLHGSLAGVVAGLGQDHVGSNNIPLLQKDGNFGTRFAPKPSAARYIYAYGSEDFFNLFNKDDTPQLKHQTFEGHNIEPVFYVPTLPLLLVNGSGENVSSGFAQKILPRNPKKLVKYIKAKITGKNIKPDLTPWYNGFNGTVEQGETHEQWIIKGTVDKLGVNKVLITELPVGYNLKSYIKILDDLEDKKKIQRYTDKSENDKFKFEVTIPSKVLSALSNDELLRLLKLVKVKSENYTVMNQDNKIQVFDSAKDILDAYIEIKLHYMQLRKDNLISTLEEKVHFDNSRYNFIESIVTEYLVINKRKKTQIESDLEKFDKIFKKDGNYDYLLRMPLYNLTLEEMAKLKDKIKLAKNELKELKKKPVFDMWLEDLK